MLIMSELIGLGRVLFEKLIIVMEFFIKMLDDLLILFKLFV